MDAEKEHYLHFVYLLLQVTPRALERFVDRNYPGGIYRAMLENRDKLKDSITNSKILTTECWKELEKYIEEEHGPFGRFANDIVNNTVLDKDVLDSLITNLHLSFEDSEIVEKCTSQLDRNQAVLDLLAKRGCDKSVLIEALKNSHQAEYLVRRMTTQSDLMDNADELKSNREKGGTKLKLQKSYSKIIKSLATTEALVDKLIEHGILKIMDSEEIRALSSRDEKNRNLMKKLMTRDENACQVFIHVLEEDPIDKVLAEEIKNVKITENEQKLTSKGVQSGLSGRCRLLPVILLTSLTNVSNRQVNRKEIPETRANKVHAHKPLGYAYRKNDGDEEDLSKSDGHDQKLNLNIVLNKLRNLYQMIFEMSETMTEDEFTIVQKTIEEIFLSLGEEPDVSFKSLSKSDFEQLEETLQLENERRLIIRATKEKDERQSNFNDLSEDIEWRKANKMLVKTRAIDHVLKTFDEHSFVVITGPPGSGKTFTARHVALLFQCKGFGIKQIIDWKDIHYIQDTPTVFVVDDIFGNFIASQQSVESWQQFFCSPFYKRIQNDPMIKIISSCRLHVYRDECVSKIKKYITCECNLSSEENRLDTQERERFMEKFIDAESFSELPEATEDGCFVLLCTLFKKEHSLTITVRDYFANPIAYYEECINQLHDHGQSGRYKLCCLAMCVMYNNMIKKDMLERKSTENERKMYRDLTESLGLDGKLGHLKIRESFDSLVGTFLIEENGTYRTIHDKIFDIIAKLLSPRIFDCIIDFGDSEFIHERCVWQQNENTELMVIIPDVLLDSYIARCISDWKSGKVRMVFSNINFKNFEFRTKLIEHMKGIKDLENFGNTKDTFVPKTDHGAGDTPLNRASYYGYIDIVDFLLIHKAYVNEVSDDGVSPLFFASQEGHLDIVCKLLEMKADVNLSDKDQVSPLYIACYQGHLDIVCKLLEMKADVNLSDKYQYSPLCIACQEGHQDIVCKLLEMKADVNLSGFDGGTALISASLHNEGDIVSLLLKTGSNCNYRLGRKKFFESYLLSQGATDLDVNKDLIFEYIMGKISESASTYINMKTDPKDYLFEKYIGSSALHLACIVGSSKVIEVLIQHKADVNLTKEDGTTPLFYACEFGHLEAVELLLKEGASSDISRVDGRYPFDIAQINGHLDIVSLLLKKKQS